MIIRSYMCDHCAYRMDVELRSDQWVQSLVNLLNYCENPANQCPPYEVPNIRQQLADVEMVRGAINRVQLPRKRA